MYWYLKKVKEEIKFLYETLDEKWQRRYTAMETNKLWWWWRAYISKILWFSVYIFIVVLIIGTT